MITVVVQRETRPHLDPWLASISNLAHWQIVWCVLIILLLESGMMDKPNAFCIGLMLVLANAILCSSIFIDTTQSLKRVKIATDMLEKRQTDAALAAEKTAREFEMMVTGMRPTMSFMGSSNGSVGFRWFPLVSVGFRWFPLVFVGFRWFSLGLLIFAPPLFVHLNKIFSDRSFKPHPTA